MKRDTVLVPDTEITILQLQSWDMPLSFPTFAANLFNQHLKEWTLGTREKHVVLCLSMMKVPIRKWKSCEGSFDTHLLGPALKPVTFYTDVHNQSHITYYQGTLNSGRDSGMQILVGPS